uniref:Uncharacterized protein n=1 Tax=Romanomermis culicivorax TaxID=13658 RepID=A0A915K3I7_ROMCU
MACLPYQSWQDPLKQLASSGDSSMWQSMSDGSNGSTAPAEDTDQTAASFNFKDYMEDENPQ